MVMVMFHRVTPQDTQVKYKDNNSLIFFNNLQYTLHAIFLKNGQEIVMSG
ncbi:3706_t:CDS:2 [Funneliformis geosporum]|nr:3706_t:CDS:2 [Funneliformis geosporum]